MSEQTEGPEAPYTITLKGGAGFESPWLVVRATSAEDAVALLAEASMNELPETIAQFAADFRAKAGAAPAQAAGGARTSDSPSRSARTSTTGRQSAPRGAAPQSQQGDVEYHPEGLVCGAPGCGKAIYLKHGTSKVGNAYQVWTCPDQRQKNDGHFSEYVR